MSIKAELRQLLEDDEGFVDLSLSESKEDLVEDGDSEEVEGRRDY